jgi:predicted DNA-binding transcriptional regulator AlpA
MSHLLSKQATAALLGIHPASLMRLVRGGHFVQPVRLHPSIRGRVRFDESDVNAWMNARKGLPHLSEGAVADGAGTQS